MPKYYNQTEGRTGRKNLKRLDDGRIKNQHGVIFTEEERRKLVSAVNQSQAKRRKQLEEVAKLPRTNRGKKTGDTLATKLDSGYEPDFIITAKSKSLQRFQNKREYTRYMNYLKRVNSGEYLNDRTRLYKKNYIQAIKNVHGADADDIVKKVRYMRLDKFRKMIEQDELLEIAYVYTTEDLAGERERLRESFGMEEEE